jgi:hypothetical protein
MGGTDVSIEIASTAASSGGALGEQAVIDNAAVRQRMIVRMEG